MYLLYLSNNKCFSNLNLVRELLSVYYICTVKYFKILFLQKCFKVFSKTLVPPRERDIWSVMKLLILFGRVFSKLPNGKGVDSKVLTAG